MMLASLRSLNNRIFHRIRLTTKLMVMMLALLALSLTASVVLSHMAQQALIQEIEESINDLSNATAVSLEQLSGEPDAGQLQKLLGRLVRKGVKEIKLLDVEKEVVASSPPPQTGRKMESTVVKGGLREYNVTAPLVDGTELLGYIHVTFTLDDLTQVNKAALYKRVAVTLLIFSLGILASLYLARKYTHPLHGVVEAAKRVAAGDLTKTIEVEGADEIAELTRSFNEMVEKLRQHRELEERLREAERLSAVGKLASGIAHEIRNPLNFISLSIDHMRTRVSGKRTAELAEVQVLMGNIKDEIHRLNSMVENFLTVGKPLSLKKTDVVVGTLIRDVVGLARQKALEQGITIRIQDDPSIPRLSLDPVQVKTCLMNVVLNAIQAMPTGGVLTIITEYRPLPSEGGAEAGYGGKINVSVTDTGSGIGDDDLTKIFTPYFTTKKLGIGLGLAITKKIVEEHGGQITVKSRAQGGTTFVISLPLPAATEVAV
jgi:hypothetical protein